MQRFTTNVIGGLLCLAALCGAGEAPTPPAAPSADDKKLLDALRADDFDAREKARVKLTERGEAVRAQLDEELKKTDLDPDYRDIIKAIASHLKAADVLKDFDNPLRITLDVKDETLDKVLARIKDKFGYTVAVRDIGDKKKVTFAIKDATFFEAVDAVRRAGDLTYDRNDFMRGMVRMAVRRGGAAAAAATPADASALLVLRENTDGQLVPACAKGPVLVMIESLTNSVSKTINFGNGGKKAGASNKHLTLQGWVLVEPGLRFSGIGMEDLKGFSAKDEKFAATNTHLHNYYGGEDSNDGLESYNFSTFFNSTDDGLTEFTLKGKVKLAVPLKMTETKIESLKDKIGKAQEVFGGTFTIEKLEFSGGNWLFNYAVTGNLTAIATGTLGWNMGNDQMTGGSKKFAARMNIQDANGKNVTSNGYSSDGDGTTYHLQTRLSAEPSAIVFRKPAESNNRLFEIEMPKVPLP